MQARQRPEPQDFPWFNCISDRGDFKILTLASLVGMFVLAVTGKEGNQ